MFFDKIDMIFTSHTCIAVIFFHFYIFLKKFKIFKKILKKNIFFQKKLNFCQKKHFRT